MTVCAVIRVPGQGAVLVSDGRYSGPESGEIFSDTFKKWCVFGSVAAVFAGHVGGLMLDLEEKPPRNWAELRERIKDLEASDQDREYDVLLYDRTKDRIIHSGNAGDAALPGNHGVIGCGGSIALGVLDAAKAPTTLEAAAKLAFKAVKIACKRNVFCGGRIRTVIVRGRKGSAEVR